MSPEDVSMFLAYALAGILVPSAIVQRRVARIRDLFDRGQEVARRPANPRRAIPIALYVDPRAAQIHSV